MDLILKVVALAMGVAVTVPSVMNQIETAADLKMLSIGLACLAILQFSNKPD